MGGPRVVVRAPSPHDGPRLAELWRHLWDVHESWGSYPGSRDEKVYKDLGLRLGEEARARGPLPLSGRHVHLVATLEDGREGGPYVDADRPERAADIIGQVEGWLDRHGSDPRTKWTCEVRSLVVSEETRHVGAARALLKALAMVTREALHGTPALLAAEVLEENPAMAFYLKLGFFTPAYSVRLRTARAQDVAVHPSHLARLAVPEDALALTFLEANLAERRRLSRDERFDRPRALDASLVDAIAIHLATVRRTRGTNGDPAELVVVDRHNVPRASATLAFAPLEPPFLPGVRAMLSRASIDATTPANAVMPCLVRLAGRISRLAGAEHLEVVDLPAPGSTLHAAALAVGGTPWSRVALRDVSLP